MGVKSGLSGLQRGGRPGTQSCQYILTGALKKMGGRRTQECHSTRSPQMLHCYSSLLNILLLSCLTYSSTPIFWVKKWEKKKIEEMEKVRERRGEERRGEEGRGGRESEKRKRGADDMKAGGHGLRCLRNHARVNTELNLPNF